MAVVLVSESDPGVEQLLEAVIARSGYEPLLVSGRRDSELPDGALLVAEPAYGNGLRHARAFRDRGESLPIVLVSILPPETAFLELAPAAYLVKPFAVARLGEALVAALTSSAAAGRSRGRPSPAARG